MTSRERVEAAISLEVADRPPMGLWGHDYLREWSADELARSHIDSQRQFGWDFVKFQPRATCFAEAFGAEFRASGEAHRSPVLVNPAIRDPEDWDLVQAVSATVPPLADQVEAVRLVAAALDPDVPVIQTVFSPLSVADFMLGVGPRAVVPHLREHAPVLKTAMSRIAGTLTDFARRSVDAGASGIFYAVVGFASGDALSAAEYEELALPHDLEVLDALPPKAWFNVVHLCGPRVHFGLGRRMPGRAISWSTHEAGNPSLQEGIEQTGRAAMGGIAQLATLSSGTPAEIAAEARAAAGANAGRGVLVAPGCSVPTDVPAENLLAVSEALSAG